MISIIFYIATKPNLLCFSVSNDVIMMPNNDLANPTMFQVCGFAVCGFARGLCRLLAVGADFLCMLYIFIDRSMFNAVEDVIWPFAVTSVRLKYSAYCKWILFLTMIFKLCTKEGLFKNKFVAK